MSHIPVNHRLQPAYRLLAFLCGVFVFVFGITGVVRTRDHSLFFRGSDTVFGLRMNLAFAIISIIVGAIIMSGAIYGRNVDHFINIVGGVVFLVAGMLMLGVMQTTANFLNFQVATSIVSFAIGIVLFAAGMYGRVGDRDFADREERFRRHHAADPQAHRWAYKGAPPRPAEDHPDGHRFA